MQDTGPTLDEMTGADGSVREPYADYHRWIEHEDTKSLRRKVNEAEAVFFVLEDIARTLIGRSDVCGAVYRLTLR